MSENLRIIEHHFFSGGEEERFDESSDDDDLIEWENVANENALEEKEESKIDYAQLEKSVNA